MAWGHDIVEQVRDEFIEAQDFVARYLTRRWWKAHAVYVKRHQESKRRHTLRTIRQRLYRREVIACADPKCRIQFVPYRENTKYCSDSCRIRHLAREAARRHAASNTARHMRICARGKCRVHFDHRRADAIYCSMQCAAAEARRTAPSAQRSRAKPRASAPCEHCGYVFERQRKTKRFCSDKCSFAAWAAVHRKAVA